MGDAVLNTLTSLREEAIEALRAEGIKAADYTVSDVVPPVAVVMPAPNYISTNTEASFADPYTVTLTVLLVGPSGQATNTATEIDSMIARAIVALDDWEFTEVGAPSQVSIGGNPYMGALLTLQQNTSIKKEVM